MKMSHRWSAVVLGSVCLAVLISACGDSSSSDTESGEEAGASSEVGAEAAKLVARAERAPTEVPEALPVKKPIPQGKKVVFLGCGAQGCEAYGRYIGQGAEALGWDYKGYPGSVAPGAIDGYMKRIVGEHPDVFIACCLPPSVVGKYIAQMKSEGTISIMCCTNKQGTQDLERLLSGPEHGIVAGKALADLMLAQEGEDLDVLWLTSSDFEVHASYDKGVRDEVERLCPECGFEELDISTEEVAKPTLTTRIVSHLRSHPDINYIAMMIGEMGIGLPAAMKAAGIEDVKITAASSNETGLAAIKKGDEFWGGGFYFGPEWGLFALNVALRTMLDEPQGEETLTPEYLVTDKNNPDVVEIPPVIPDALEQYEEVWGVG
jgi:ribose transport system substrate-binding protein